VLLRHNLGAGPGDRHIRMLKNILLIINLLLLGACSTGMVAGDVDLTLSDVRINQSDQVQVGAEFSHLLREEILHQFSKSQNYVNKNKKAFLSLEIQKLLYPGNQTGNSLKKSSVLSGIGYLGDEQTGSKIGDFRLSVTHNDGRYSVSGLPGTNFDQLRLIQLMAHAILKRVYGSGRASKISENSTQYVRQPFLHQPNFRVARNSVNNPDNGKISGLRLSLANGILPADFIGPPTEAVDGNKAPEVIEAPQLLIQ
jgi:hypothetical protein